MQTYLVGASDVRYKKEGEAKQFYVLRCLIPVKNYSDSLSKNLGYEQKELFVDQGVYEQAKSVKRYPVPVDLSCETDPFKNRVRVTNLKVVDKAA
jgi:hypothetical protein